MYYKVYGNINGWKEIDRTKDERDIIDTIGYYVGNTNRYEYLIILVEKDQDIPYKTINSREEYIQYIQEINEKCKESVKRTKK